MGQVSTELVDDGVAGRAGFVKSLPGVGSGFGQLLVGVGARSSHSVVFCVTVRVMEKSSDALVVVVVVVALAAAEAASNGRRRLDEINMMSDIDFIWKNLGQRASLIYLW